MPKTFYTDHDIEDMVRRGIQSLTVTDNVVITDLAYEKAKRLGMSLVYQTADTPPGAPIRPYITKSGETAAPAPAKAAQSAVPTPAGGIAPLAVLPGDKQPSAAGFPQPACACAQKPAAAELRVRIREAVINRFGSQVDSKMLDAIIERTLTKAGAK